MSAPVPGQPFKADEVTRIVAVDDDRHGRMFRVEVRVGAEDWAVHAAPRLTFATALEEAQRAMRRERAQRPADPPHGAVDYRPDSDPTFRPDQTTPWSRPDGRIDMQGLANKIRRARELKGLRA